LILSGLPPDRSFFAGFPPPRSAARRKALAAWAGLDATLIFFEGPSRIAGSLADMAAVFGDRPAAVGRELTKRHEELRRGTLATLAASYGAEPAPRGELVIVISPPQSVTADAVDIDERLDALLAQHSLRDAVAMLAAETRVARGELYGRALARQRKAARQ